MFGCFFFKCKRWFIQPRLPFADCLLRVRLPPGFSSNLLNADLKAAATSKEWAERYEIKRAD